MKKTDKEMDAQIREELKRDADRRTLFARLLDAQRQKGHIFAQKVRMGITDSYIASVDLDWIDGNILFAGDLPLFEKEYANSDSKEVSINDQTVDFIQQRNPDWRRQLPMTVYLAEREHHKFPPLLIVCYQKWTYHKDDNKWGPDGRAVSSSVPIKQLDHGGYFFDIADSESSYYALDGQHRLMAIKGLKDLLSNGRLHARTKNREIISKKVISLSEEEILPSVVSSIMERRHRKGEKTSRAEVIDELHKRMKETIGVEIIPAVQEGETLEEAVSRLREIFVDVNEQAKRPGKADLAMLDNNNGFRIVARRIMTKHKLLDDGKTSTVSTQLPEKAKFYTTVQELSEITKDYLEQIGYGHWVNPVLGNVDHGYIRPPEDEIKGGIGAMMDYFDAISKLPSHDWFINANERNRWKLRNSAIEKEGPDKMLLDNILFRPIAQRALAKAIGQILAAGEFSRAEPRKIREKLNELVARMAKQEKRGLLKLREKASPWFGVLCDPLDRKMRRHKRYLDLSQLLFRYFLCKGLEDDETKDLKTKFADARRADENAWVSWEGETVDDAGKVGLPRHWD